MADVDAELRQARAKTHSAGYSLVRARARLATAGVDASLLEKFDLAIARTRALTADIDLAAGEEEGTEEER